MTSGHRRLLFVVAVLVLAAAGRGAPLVAGRVAQTTAAQLQSAAEAGAVDAQFRLGVMYANGEGVPEDDVEAVRWYRLAAAQGHASAQNDLGVMYAHGEGVPEDDGEAVKWYRLAAAQGDAGAQHNLGGMYANGLGVPQDSVLGHMWVNLGASRLTGDDQRRAIGHRNDVAAKMPPAQLAEAQALARKCLESQYKNCG